MDHWVYLTIFTCSGAIVLAILLSLAIPPRHTRKLLTWLAALALIAAMGLYGYGHGYHYLHGVTDDTLATNILRTVWDSFRFFVGANGWSTVKDAYAGYPGWEFLFWAVHLVAMTVSAGAIMTSLGSALLKRIRMRLISGRDITLIFGLNEDTLRFGRELARHDKTAIVYVDAASQSKLVPAVDHMGAVLRSDPDAVNGSVRFLKSIGLRPGKRRLNVYALATPMITAQHYAKQLLESLEKRGILPEQTALTILDHTDETDNPLQAAPGRYGYGSIIPINEPEMVARLLIRSYPPHSAITFDETGRAVTDFHAILIGLGQVGQAVLRQLVMNSQFHGSKCRITVFAPDYESRIGWLSHQCREMLNAYDITILPYDGRSCQFYDYVHDNAGSINYIAICAGNETINTEISEHLRPFLLQHGCAAPILMCSAKGVYRQDAAYRIEAQRIYTPQILCSDRIDRMAMVLNHSYVGSGDMRENWNACSYFNRMSSRAAADFYGAVMHSAGVTREEVLEHWDPQGALLENLSMTEHLRWNAFHYCMGFRPMTEAEFQARAAAFRREKEKDPNTNYRVTRDMENRIHACLIPWEALDDYSRKENAVTGAHRDYAENDRQNIRDLAKILRAMEREEK